MVLTLQHGISLHCPSLTGKGMISCSTWQFPGTPKGAARRYTTECDSTTLVKSHEPSHSSIIIVPWGLLGSRLESIMPELCVIWSGCSSVKSNGKLDSPGFWHILLYHLALLWKGGCVGNESQSITNSCLSSKPLPGEFPWVPKRSSHSGTGSRKLRSFPCCKSDFLGLHAGLPFLGNTPKSFKIAAAFSASGLH